MLTKFDLCMNFYYSISGFYFILFSIYLLGTQKTVGSHKNSVYVSTGIHFFSHRVADACNKLPPSVFEVKLFLYYYHYECYYYYYYHYYY